MAKKFETSIVNGVEIFHTFRGQHDEVEVYTGQAGNATFSLYKLPGQQAWRCDALTSYHKEVVELEANPTDEAAMLAAFADLLRARRVSAH